MRSFAAYVLLFVCVGLVGTAVESRAAATDLPAPSCLWYADDEALRQLETAGNQITVSVSLRAPHRLWMNADDCGVWALGRLDRALLRYDAQGQLERRIVLRQLDGRLDDVDMGVLDPNDGSLWVADGRWLAHIAATGELHTLTPLPRRPTDLRVAFDQGVWILAGHQLLQVAPDGKLRSEMPLLPYHSNPRYLLIDHLNDRLWIAGETRVLQFDRLTPQQPLRSVTLSAEVKAVALNPHRGEVWIATAQALHTIDREGHITRRIDLAGLGLHMPEKLAFDPVSRSLWAGFERTVARFDEEGQLVARLPARDGDKALGVPAFRVVPVATIRRPPADGLTNQPTPLLEVGYDALCNGRSCGFASAAYAGYRLAATLNGTAIGDRFVFDPATGTAGYTPSARLPEGANTLTVQATDRFGQASAITRIGFTIDTVPPRFAELAPASGSVLRQPAVTLRGKTDEQASVVFENKDQFAVQGANPQDTAFSWTATLNPGLNTVRLSAIDRAGNATSQVLALTYLPPGVDFSIDTPAAGASLGDDQVLVSGRYAGTGAVGITVNGLAAALAGDRFQAVVPLTPGPNAITVIATTLDGVKTTKTLTITASAPPIKVNASPSPALAGTPVSFSLSAPNPPVRIEADYDGDGVADQTAGDPAAPLVFTYTAPGIYTAAFTVTDGQNQTLQKKINVVVQDVQFLDSQIRTVYQGMIDRLIQRDVNAATAYLTPEAVEKYTAVFNDLGEGLPAAAANLGTLTDGAIGDGLAEYLIVRSTPAGPRGFLIYFVKDRDGLWRIGSM